MRSALAPRRLPRAFGAVVILIALAEARCAQEAQKPAPSKKPTPEVTNTGPVPKPMETKEAKPPQSEPVARDLDAITADGTLPVIFTFNSTGYFVYRGETMGYEYELLSLFAKESHLRLRPVVVRDSKLLFEKLNRGEGDIVAAQLAATTNQSEVLETVGLYATSPVVVQRNDDANPTAGATPTVAKAIARAAPKTATETTQVRARLVSTPAELAGQTVHVPRSSPYRTRLLELNDELNHDIEVVEVDESSDRLIRELAGGEIDYTVAAENMAALKSGEFRNLVIRPAIGPPQPIVWAVRRTSPKLQNALNQWIAAKKKAGLLAVLYRKYFLDRRGFQRRGASQFLSAETGVLSPFDAWFRQYASVPGWDWRLIAAQAFQESRFNPAAVSWAGARGLMQIMPATARQMKVNPANPEQSIAAACRYLWQLDSQWKADVPNESERIRFILASYNVGLGHVQDAVRLAKSHGDNPQRWSDVAYWLIRKSTRAVYNDPVVKHGFARGTEPVTYVDEIMGRWENYREFVPAETTVPGPVPVPAESTSAP
ncbi:MAG: transglycosylase SLT domain-containing protein [Acidobacteria bacterium]|nr:transglycosylase SLT domain-containing protein [Acidobacteriota bacterium]